MREEHRYDSDVDGSREPSDRDLRIILGLIKRSQYVENGDHGWSKYTMPGLVTLVVTGIIGNVIQYAQVSSLKTALEDFTTSMERRVNNLEQKIYRGAP